MSSLWDGAEGLAARVTAGEGAVVLASRDEGEGEAGPTGTEAGEIHVTVERPPPGLARGRWEAPAWMFWAVIAAAVVGSALWLARSLRRARVITPRTRRPAHRR